MEKFGKSAGYFRRQVRTWLAEGTFDGNLPEVAALKGVPQRSEYHLEGDAYQHSLLAMEAVRENADLRVFWGALLHDIGKKSTTAFIDGRWRAHGHDIEGAALVPVALARVGITEIAGDVQWLVKNHLFHLSWNLKPGDTLTLRQRRFMGHELFPLLLEICAADAQASWGASIKGDVINWLASQL